MPAPYATSQGTTFTFDGDTYYCTSIKVSVKSAAGGSGQMDVSTLDLAEGDARVYQDSPLVDPNAPATDGSGNQTTITIAFMGSDLPAVSTTASLVTAGISGNYRCTEAEKDYAVGDMIKGTATFVSAPA